MINKNWEYKYPNTWRDDLLKESPTLCLISAGIYNSVWIIGLDTNFQGDKQFFFVLRRKTNLIRKEFCNVWILQLNFHSKPHETQFKSGARHYAMIFWSWLKDSVLKIDCKIIISQKKLHTNGKLMKSYSLY